MAFNRHKLLGRGQTVMFSLPPKAAPLFHEWVSLLRLAVTFVRADRPSDKAGDDVADNSCRNGDIRARVQSVFATILTSMIGAPPLARHTPVENNKNGNCGNSTILLPLLGHADEVVE